MKTNLLHMAIKHLCNVVAGQKLLQGGDCIALRIFMVQ